MLKKYEEIIKYIIAGVLTTIVSITSYNLFRNINVSYKTSTILSWILAVLFAYFINKIYVFNKSEKDKIEFFKFIISRLLSLLIEFITMIILVDIFIINDRLSKLIVQVIVFILNYVFSKFIVFKK